MAFRGKLFAFITFRGNYFQKDWISYIFFSHLVRAQPHRHWAWTTDEALSRRIGNQSVRWIAPHRATATSHGQEKENKKTKNNQLLTVSKTVRNMVKIFLLYGSVNSVCFMCLRKYELLIIHFIVKIDVSQFIGDLLSRPRD